MGGSGLMENTRRFIIDTDTGADDAWAIVEALRASGIARVEAVTVVFGNFELDLCVKNALLAAEAAGTYVPPVYAGMERAIMSRRMFRAERVHGEDGLGGMRLPPPAHRAEERHAVDAIIDLVMEHPGEIEIVTCGPLTNLAMACLKEPRLAGNVKRAWILGGTAGARGNLTAAAEYNVGSDPEAAAIVLDAGFDAVWVTWDNARGDTEITPEEVERLLSCGSAAARFCGLCSRDLARFYEEKYGKKTFGVIDSMVMTAALFPETMEEVFEADCAIELCGRETRGDMRAEPCGKAGNGSFSGGTGGAFCEAAGESVSEGAGGVVSGGRTRLCTRMNAAEYKKKLFSLLGC